MPLQAKIAATQQELTAASSQSVDGTLTLSQASDVALDVHPEAVAGYSREGGDLVVHLKDGENLRIANYYAPGQAPSHLYLVDDQMQLVSVDLPTAVSDGALAASYESVPVTSGFESLTEAAAVTTTGTAAAGGIAGLGTLGTVGVIGGGLVVAGAGVAAASNSNSGGGGGSSSPSAPAAATDLQISATGEVLSGRATAGSTVHLDVDGDGLDDQTTTADGNGNFQFTLSPPLVNGETVTVHVQTSAGTSAATQASAPDLTPPDAASGVVVAPDGSNVSGHAEAGATVSVDTNGDGQPDASTQAGSDGSFQIPLNPPLTNGQTITVTVTDPAGHPSSPVTVSAPDTTAPDPASGVVVAADGSSVSGHAEAGATVSLDLDGDGQPDTSVVAGNDGSFQIPLTPPLTNGQTLSVTVTDPAGNPSTPVSVVAPTVVPEAPTLNPTDGQSLSGTAPTGSTVLITDGNGNTVGSTTVDSSGQWSYNPAPPLNNGSVVNVVTQSGGQTSAPTQGTVDNSVPSTPTGDATDGAEFSGTAAAGSSVSLWLSDGTLLGSTTADAQGNWSFNASPRLSHGTLVRILAQNAAGHVSGDAWMVVDSTAPAAPTVQASDGATFSGTAEAGSVVTISAASGTALGSTVADANGHWSFSPATPLADGSQVQVVAQDAAGNVSDPTLVTTDAGLPAAPTLAPSNGLVLSGTGVAGSQVEVVRDDGQILGRVTVGQDGRWSLTPNAPLADGVSVSAHAVDAAGAVGPSVSVQIDALAPNAPQVAASNGSLLQGSAEAGSLVILSLADGSQLGSVTAGADGRWSFTPTTALGDGVAVQVTATDAAGNVSAPTRISVDAVAPAAPALDPSNGTSFSGNAEPGSTVILSGPAGVLGSASVDASGHWSFTTSAPLANGSAVSVVARDAAGNSGPASGLVTDSSLPPAPSVAPSDGSHFSGYGVAGNQVVLLDANGQEIGRTTVGSDGHWSLLATTPQADGASVSAHAVNAVGTSGPSSSVIVDALPPATPSVNPSNGSVFSGSAEAASLVTLSLADGTVLGTVRADASGHWQFNPAAAVADSTVVSVVARDAAGNPSLSASVSVDGVPPGVPTVGPSDGSSFSGSAEPGSVVLLSGPAGLLGSASVDANGIWTFVANPPQASGSTVNVVAVDAAGNAGPAVTLVTDASLPSTPTIAASDGSQFNGTGQPGLLVVVDDSTGQVLGSTTVSAEGRWTFTPPVSVGDGATISVHQVNALGLSGPAASVTVDALAPDAPQVAPSMGDSFNGTAEAGSLVLVLDASQNVIGQARVDASGHWSFIPANPLPDSTSLSFVARDAAGNTSDATALTVDRTPPATPSVSASNGNQLSGNAEANSTVLLSIDGGAPIPVSVDANGHWQYTPPARLADGAQVSVIAQDAAGNQSPAASTIVDALAPGAPQVSVYTGSELAGSAEANATVFILDAQGGVLGSTSADASGHWQFTPGTAWANGTQVQVSAQDAVGNRGVATNVTIDAVAPASPTLAASNGVNFHGTAQVGVIVVLNGADGSVLGSVVADAQGQWSLTLGVPQANGVQVSAQAHDLAGNVSGTVSTTVDNVAPDAPTVVPSNGSQFSGSAEANAVVLLTDAQGNLIGSTSADAGGAWNFSPASVADGTQVLVWARDAAGNLSGSAAVIVDAVAPSTPTLAASNGSVVSGSGDVGSIVRLSVNGSEYASVTVGADGTWRISPSPALGDGTALSVNATDAVGNQSASVSAVVDAIPPAAPSIDPSNGQVLQGSAEIGSTVTLTDGSGNLLGQTQTDASGHWSFTPGTALADGTQVLASATDAAGNTSTTQATTQIDAQAPAAPQVAASNGSVISGSAEIGSSVLISIAGGTPVSVQVGSSGTWSYTPGTVLADGTSISVSARDAAGNQSAATSLTVDRLAPDAPSLTPSNGSFIEGHAEANSTVLLVLDGAPAISIQVDASGTWRYTPPSTLANGTSISATAQDAAGNVSDATTGSVDSIAPNPPVISPSNGTLITGTAESGDTITLIYANGVLLGQAETQANGAWTFTPTAPLPDGTQITVVAQDAAGNASTVATVTIDAVAPAAPVLAASNGASFSGSAEIGSTVTLTSDNGATLIGSVVVGASGTWVITPTTAVGNDVQVSATATDAAGNVSSAASTVVDSLPPAEPQIEPTNGSVLSGSGEANALIVLSVGGSAIGSVTADASGNWQFTPSSALANNTVVSVTAQDAAGNLSQATTVEVDSSLPSTPVVNPSNGVSISGSADADITVYLYDGSGNLLGSTSADSGGAWQFTPGAALANGTQVVVQAHNVQGTSSGNATLVIDALAPNAPQITASNGVTLSGSAEIGSLVIISVGGSAIGSATAGADGSWSFTPGTALVNGVVVSVVARDAASNISTASSITIDSIAPVVLINPSNGTRISGSGEIGSLVTLHDGDGHLIGSVVVDGNGQWSLTPVPILADGARIDAVASDAAGNASAVVSTTVDNLAPGMPTINASNGVTLSGTAEAGATLVLVDGNGTSIGSVVVDGSGRWSFTPGTALTNGVLVKATAVDAAGNVSVAASTTIDTVAPATPTLNPSNGGLVSGTAEAGAHVVLSDGNGTQLGQATADANGSWSLTLSPSLLNGSSIQAVAVDAAGNTSGAISILVDAVAPSAPVISASNGTLLSGTAEIGALVILSDANGNLIGSVTADANGAWSLTPGTALGNGVVVNALARDAAGNLSVSASITVDSVAPVAPILAASNGALISGTAEANALVILTTASGTSLGSVSADANGIWSFTPGTALGNGVVVNVQARDAAGNTSVAATLTVDSVAPGQPTIAATTGVTLQGTAEANALVILTTGTGTSIGSVSVDASGHWSFTPGTALANGVQVLVVARDAAGNTSQSASTLVDNVAPGLPGIAASNGVLLHGTAEIGALVIVSDGLGNVLGSVTADASGAWSLTPPNALANGTLVSVVARDAAGNTSQAVSTTIDALAPNVPTALPSNGLNFSGTAEIGAIVILQVGGVALGSVQADASGNWSLSLGSALANATSVSVTATDAVGNVSAALTLVTDGIAPLAPVLSASNGTVLSGTAEAGALVTVSSTSGVLGSVQVDASGHWSLTLPSAQATGVVLSAVARDAAGNLSGTAQVTVDASLPAPPVINPSNGLLLGGTATLGTTVIISGPSGVIASVAVDASGHWSYTPASGLANGATISVVAQSASGNLSAAATTVIDNVAPALPVINPSNGVALGGTAEVGATIRIVIAGVLTASVTVDASGHWSYAPGSTLGNGTLVSVTAVDAAGNVSVAANTTIDRVAPNLPVLNPSNGSVLSGSAEAGAVLTFSGANGALLGTVTADVNGRFSFTPGTPLANGLTVSVTATDAAGNVSSVASVVIDAVAPVVPVLQSFTGALVSGTAEIGSTVLIRDASGNTLASISVDASGHWSYTPSTALANGTVLSAVAVDAAGNVSVALPIVVDALAPLAPVVNPSNGSSLSGSAEVGATVILSVAGVAVASVTVDASGHWSFTPGTALANGTVVSVVAKDVAGNLSVAAGISVDSVAPTIPSSLVFNAGGTLLTGLAEANSQLRIVVNGDTANPLLVTVGANGTFSVSLSPALAAGQLLSVTATDAAGNTSTALVLQAPDLTRPVVSIAEAADNYINAAEIADGIQVRVALTAGARAGQTLQLNYSGLAGFALSSSHVLTAAEITAGVALVTLAGAFPQGAASVTATVNGGLASSAVGFTVDTIAPTTPVLALVGDVLQLTGEANSYFAVNLAVAGVTTNATVLADATGHASVSLLAGLSSVMTWDQLLHASASVTSSDLAGNTSTAASLDINALTTAATVTLGNFALAVSLIPTTLGLSGTAAVGATLSVDVVTPLATVTLHPIVDSSGNFTINLLSSSLLSQLGLSITQLLNLGAGLSFNLTSTDAAGHTSPTYSLTLLGSGATLKIGEVDITGTAGNDIISGSTGVEHMFGGAGNDLFLHVNTGDFVQGGAGNDTIQISGTGFASLDGGTGFDTLMLDTGINLNYAAGATVPISNIERIDMGASNGANSVTLTSAQVNAITDSGNTLQVTGGSNDVLRVSGAVNTNATQQLDGHTYDVYSYGTQTLLVEHNTVQVVTA
ncbi:MAG: hypothetical protein GAK45_00048 [Pseudomonas citronellolis]|nr:MAG: hypothetical protein GAK45_00048 [Pseudomonas citronellolis]